MSFNDLNKLDNDQLNYTFILLPVKDCKIISLFTNTSVKKVSVFLFFV